MNIEVGQRSYRISYVICHNNFMKIRTIIVVAGISDEPVVKVSAFNLFQIVSVSSRLDSFGTRAN